MKIIFLILSPFFSFLALHQTEEPAQEANRARKQSHERLNELFEVRAFVQLVKEFEKSVQPNGALSNDGKAIATVAQAAIETGQLDFAKELLETARPKSAGERVAIEKARLLFARDELEQAAKALTLESEKGTRLRFSKEPRAWLLFARTKARLQNYGSAAQAAENYLRLSPYGVGSATAWQIRADAALRKNEPKKAHALIAKAKEHRQWHELFVARTLQCRQDPKAELPKLGLALLWMEANVPERAREGLVPLLESSPEFCRGWFHLGEAERALAEFQAAEQAYSKALECDPKHAPSRSNRAALRAETGNLEGSSQDYEILLSGPNAKDPRYLEGHLGFARVLKALGMNGPAKMRYSTYRSWGGKGNL